MPTKVRNNYEFSWASSKKSTTINKTYLFPGIVDEI